MSEFVTVREFDRYREGIQRELEQLRRDIEESADDHDTDMRELRGGAQHDREWTWTRKIGLFMAAIALAGLELQYLASHR